MIDRIIPWAAASVLGCLMVFEGFVRLRDELDARTPLTAKLMRIEDGYCLAMSKWAMDARDTDWCDGDELADAASERANMLRKSCIDEMDILITRHMAKIPRSEWRREMLAISKQYHERSKR